MALFDPDNPTGDEVKAAYGLRDRLSELSVFQELAEADDATDAKTHITVGQFDEPADGVEFDVNELAELGFQVRIVRADGERIATVDGYAQHSGAGRLAMLFRRYVRESEDEQDAYLFVWDRLDKLQQDLAAALSTADCPRVQQGALLALSGPWRGMHSEQASQGAYIHAAMTVPWGDALDD